MEVELMDKQRKKSKKGEKRASNSSKTLISGSGNGEDDQIGGAEGNSGRRGSEFTGIEVSKFDESVKNHFRAMEMIYKLSGRGDCDWLDEREIERLAFSIVFLSEWRYFNYEPRNIRFVSETGLPNNKEAVNEINLSQFSAASAPKCEMEAEIGFGALTNAELGKDFVLYVGGLVWALDWCPRLNQETNSDTNCEFIAVSAHPPDSSYHKLGACLSGRGMIQIWCLLNSASTRENVQAPFRNTKQKSHKNTVSEDENKPKKPRGRPRKNAVDKTPADGDPESLLTQALVPIPENTSDVLPTDDVVLISPISQNTPVSLDNTKQKVQKNVILKEESKPKKSRGRPRKNLMDKTPDNGDPKGQYVQPLQLPEDTSNVPTVDGNTMSTPPVSWNLSSPAGNTKQTSQENAALQKESKPKKFRGKPRRKVIEVRGMGHAPDQFMQTLALQLPEDTSNVPPVDENIRNDLAPSNEKIKKRKAVTNGKKTAGETVDEDNSEGPFFQALAIEFPENIPDISCAGERLLNTPDPQDKSCKKRKISTEKAPLRDLECTISDLLRRSRNMCKAKCDKGHDSIKHSTQNEGEIPSPANQQENVSEKGNGVSKGVEALDDGFDLGFSGSHFPKDVVLPRVVFCLGHDGKVAWDVKWRPVSTCESINNHRMGYLAVVLGNGSIEVWEIPSPQIIKCIYPSQQCEATDPRFAKLKPVFRCSTLKSCDRQSMPLTMEWSVCSPHDLILAGCHDGMVALWKFSSDCSSEDARPLLCFSAETVPIRALSWAPFECDPESRNVIVTAGHGGLKFWDLRDPFRPLWDTNPSQHYIYSLDWLPDPRCVFVSYDDGTLRILSLSRAAYDVPVTGEPFSGTLQQGLHSYYCSSSAIWSVHISRLTGMVAYCGADGTVLYFQLTHKAVDKDPVRNRTPHFLCGALADEGSAITVNAHLPSFPHRMKKSATEWANTPRSARTVVSGLNQAKRVRKGVEKNQKPNDEVLALSYGDDLESGGAIETPKSSKSDDGKSSKQNTSSNQAPCLDGNGVNANGKANEDTNSEIEAPPSKLVSMYRVRWNMNKGSERWLCYGGAAGIVRCQEIIAPLFDKKLLKM